MINEIAATHAKRFTGSHALIFAGSRLIGGILAVALVPRIVSAALPIADIKRDAPVDFAKEIHPVLKRNCLACHNSTKAKASLNLETPELIAKGGDSGPAATAGKGGESRILKFAAHRDDEAMPPPDNKVNAVNLTADELGLLKLWIDQGMKGAAAAPDAVISWRGISGGTIPVTAAALSPNGEIAAAARGNRVALFEVPTGNSLGYVGDPELAKLDLYRDKPAADRDAVMAVAFGASDLLATGGYRTVRLWRRAPLNPLRESATLAEPALCLAAAGNMAAIGDAAGRVWFWDTTAEKPQPVELKDHAAPVKAIAISADAQFIVSAGEDKSVRIWKIAEKSVVLRAESPAAVATLCFLKGGTLLAAAGVDGMLRTWAFPVSVPAPAVVTQTPAAETPPPPGVVQMPKPAGEFRLADKAPAFLCVVDPAGTRLIWGNGDAVLREFDAGDGKAGRELTCENIHASSVRRFERRVESARRQADARKSRAAAAAEAANKESAGVKTAHEAMEKARADWQRKLEAVGAAADSLRNAPEDNGRKEAAKKADNEAEAAEKAFVSARTNAELSVRLAGQALQAKVAAEAAQSAADVTLKEAEASLEVAKKSAAAPVPPVKSAVVLHDTRTVLLALDGGRLHWHSLESGVLCDATEGAVSLLATAGEQLLAAQPDKKTRVLPQRRLWQHERTIGNLDNPSVFAGRVTALDFSSDGRLLATGGGILSRSGEVKIWNARDGSHVMTLKDPHSDTVNALAFSPDSSLLATAGSDRWARVFRVSDGQRTAAFEGHASHVLSVAWRSDGLALATGGADKTLRVWDLPDAKSIRTNNSFGKEVSAVAWLGAGDSIACASGDSSVRLNDDRLPGAKGFTFCLAADSAGRLIAAGGEDGVLRVWNAQDRKLLREYSAP